MPGFLSRAGGAVVDALTPDRGYAPPTVLGPHHQGLQLANYLRSTAHGFDPRTPQGLLNIATILVPGGRGRGRMTQEQQKFVNAIFLPSYKESRYGSYNFSDPSVAALHAQIGGPPTLPHMNPPRERGSVAYNPLSYLTMQEGTHGLGVTPGVSFLPRDPVLRREMLVEFLKGIRN